MKVAIGCDPNAKALKDILAKVITDSGHQLVDMGGEDPIYANTAFTVAEAVSKNECDRGVLLCGTGIGMSLAANKVPGAYAALCSDIYSVERSVLSNNANILCLGAFTLGVECAKMFLHRWLELEYIPGGRSEPKIQGIYKIEKEFQKQH